jgi:hypothetical protein
VTNKKAFWICWLEIRDSLRTCITSITLLYTRKKNRKIGASNWNLWTQKWIFRFRKRLEMILIRWRVSIVWRNERLHDMKSWVWIPLKIWISLCSFILSMYGPVLKAAAMRRADHSSKESQRPCNKDYETEEEATAQQRTVEPLMNEWNYIN